MIRVGEEQQGEINVSGWLQIILALLVCVALGYWLFFGEDIQKKKIVFWKIPLYLYYVSRMTQKFFENLKF